MAHDSGTGPLRLTLDRLAPRREAAIRSIDAARAGQPAERARQLSDLGFVPGEAVCVLAAAWPGDDPIVVQVGGARFALRRAEAACVAVELPR